jgi:apoptosis-inducing factor 3
VDSSQWRRVARESDLAEGGMKLVEDGTEKLLLVRRGGRVFALGHKCPHYQEKLEKGVVVGDEIICKSHQARFDVRTGRMTSPPARDGLPVYPVKVEDGEVWIGRPVPSRPAPPSGSPADDRRTFLILGAGAAGSAAAEALRREGFAGRIVMVSADREGPCDRPVLSKGFITGKDGEDKLPLRDPGFYSSQRIELLTGRRVVSLDVVRRAARLDGGEEVAFDKALLATGGAPRRLPVPGSDSPGCLVLRTADDARAILAAAAKATRVTVIGAGFVGTELAGSLRERGLSVSVTAPEDLPLAAVLGPRVSTYLKGLHEAKGVSFFMGRSTVKIEAGDRGMAVTLSDGRLLESDFVVMGAGIRPEVGYLAGTGLVEDGGVAVDDAMQSRAPGIFAAGDIAAMSDPDGGTRRVEHWTVAERHGVRAALGMLGKDPGPQEVNFFWSKQAGVSLKYVGYARRFDEIFYRGAVEDGAFLAGYYLRGELKAAATIGLAPQLIAVERLMSRGVRLSPTELADPAVDLLALARGVVRGTS